MEALIRADRRIMTDSVATELGCSHGLACNIMHDHLKFRKLWARWMPRELKGREKVKRMGLSLQRLLPYADKEKIRLTEFLLRTNHGWITTNPNQSVLQCNGHIPVHLQHKSSKFKVTPSAGKVMLTVLLDSQGALLAHFQKRGENVNSASYCEVLRNQFVKKPPGQLARGVLLHHGNARFIQPDQPRREFKNYSRNFANICLTARTWTLVYMFIIYLRTKISHSWLKWFLSYCHETDSQRKLTWPPCCYFKFYKKLHQPVLFYIFSSIYYHWRVLSSVMYCRVVRQQ
jgi:hypothetical protein